MDIIASLLGELYPLLTSPRAYIRPRPSRMIRLHPFLNLSKPSCSHVKPTQPRGIHYISVFKIPIQKTDSDDRTSTHTQPRRNTNHPQAKRNCDTLNGDYDRLNRAWKDWVKSPKGHDEDGKCVMTFAEWLLAKQS